MEVLYRCEVCGNIFKVKENAEKCEARGKPQEYPVGMLFAYPGYEDIVFAVAGNHEQGHVNFISAWAARDNGCGDNYDETCTCTRVSPPKRSLPAFQRMVLSLKQKNITITVWDGEKPVALGEFFEKCAC